VYIPAERLLHCSADYFDRIRSGIVTINLEANPNPLGAIARTVRLLVDWEVGLSRRLADFLWLQIQAHDVNSRTGGPFGFGGNRGAGAASNYTKRPMASAVSATSLPP
jgi:hypothetical protein